MADRKLMEDYENSVLSLAVSEMLEEYGRELLENSKELEDVQPSPEVAEKFQAALDKEYSKARFKVFVRKAGNAARRVMTACAVLIIVFSVSVVSVDALRFRVLDWLTNISPTHTAYNDGLNNLYVPENLPKGYQMQCYNRDEISITETFINSNNNIITLYIDYNNSTINTDNEDTNAELIDINNNVGVFTMKDCELRLMWSDGTKSFIITTDDDTISKGKIVEIAQSLK